MLKSTKDTAMTFEIIKIKLKGYKYFCKALCANLGLRKKIFYTQNYDCEKTCGSDSDTYIYVRGDDYRESPGFTQRSSQNKDYS